MSSHNSFDSDDEDSDDTSEHLDHDYDFSIGRGGKKVVNKGRWTKEEVTKRHTDISSTNELIICRDNIWNGS